MTQSSTAHSRTDCVFFAWDSRCDSLGSTLKALQGHDPRFQTLMINPRSGDITDLVFTSIARASSVVALLGEKPNVNVGFELGLALGLGKRVLATCWGTETVHSWVAQTVPFKGFITPCVGSSNKLLKTLSDKNSWHRYQPTYAQGSTRARDDQSTTYYLCPQEGIWSSCWEEFDKRPKRFLSPRKKEYSIADLSTPFSSIGRLVWVMVPESDNSPDINTKTNTGHAVVAGWFLGRQLKSVQQKWIGNPEELTRQLGAAVQSVFHPVVIGKLNPPADLNNYCKSCQNHEEFAGYLDELSPPPADLPPNDSASFLEDPQDDSSCSLVETKFDLELPRPSQIITTVESFPVANEKLDAPLRAMVNLVIIALLKVIARKIDGPERLQKEFDLFDFQLAQVICNQSLTERIDVDLNRLRRICEKFELLRDYSQDSIKNFFLKPLASWQSLLTDRIRAINPISNYGRTLVETVEERALQGQLPDRLKELTGTERTILLDPKRSRDEKNLALKSIYLRAAMHTSAENKAFTLSDFDRTLWDRVVQKSQERVPEKEWSHLHFANKAMRDSFARLLTFDKRTTSGGGAVVRVLEGGVGGANTTHYMMQGVEKALARCGISPEASRVEYHGFEINPKFCYAVNQILQGEPIPSGSGFDIVRDDPRVRYFKNWKGRFHPLSSDRSFVHLSEMSEGIDQLSREKEEGFLDLFVCSYSFHHVPNGLRLAEYLFEAENGSLPRFAKESTEFRAQFKNELLELLGVYGRTWVGPSSGHLQLTRALFDALGTLSGEKRKALINDVRSINPDHHAPWAAVYPRQLLLDRQKLMLWHVKSMLKSGGLIGIADPDGFSGFNRKEVPDNTEMAVAHFRQRTEMRNLLVKNKFEIVDDWNLLCYRKDNTGSYYECRNESIEELERRGLERLVDHNLGYILIARKS